MRIALNIKKSSYYTECQYISNIFHAEFIKRIGIGSYERIVKVPEFISSNKMCELAYNKEKRDKLISTLIRKEKLQNLEHIKLDS